MADLEGVKVAKNYHLDAPFANQQILFIKRFCHYIEFDLFRFLILIENRTPPAFCLAINHSIDKISCHSIPT